MKMESRVGSRMGSKTDKKGQIYRFIRSEISTRGLPPTIREIGKRFNISSTNGVRYFLGKLEAEGLIERKTWTARGIQVAKAYRDDSAWSPDVPSSDLPRSSRRGRGLHGISAALSHVRSVPILGRVPAGSPVVSEQYAEGTLLLDQKIVRGYEVFAVKVRGESMIEAGINDGDIAVVKKNTSPAPGDLVVALLDDEVTLKRLIKRNGDLILKPENEGYPEINLTELSHKEIRILGTVIAIVRQY
jgi:repressor LexA